MLIRVFAVICVLACLFAFVSCHDDLATKEEVKTDMEAADKALDDAKEELNAAIEEVRKTANAAALKTDLNSALARIEAAEGNIVATIEALNAAKADLTAVRAIAEAAAVKTEVDAAIAAINNAIAGCATKAELEALSTKVNTNTADIAEIEAAIADLASKTEVTEIKTALEALINANTTDIATIKATLETLATKDYVDGVKKELNDSITALKTKLEADIKALDSRVKAIEDMLDEDWDELKDQIAEVKKLLEGIDIYGSFEDKYGPLTEKLLNPEYEYAYVKFVEIVLDMTDGPYDPSDVKNAKLQAENILFNVMRATSEDGLKELYEELVAIKTGLKTLEESLTEKLANITYVNTSKENIDAINAAKKVYDRIIELEIEFENAELKARFERIWNANLELNGDGTIANPGLKNDAYTSIDKAIATLVGRDVKLGSNDKDVIDNYQAAIVALKTAIDNSEYRDLYEPGLADGVINATKAEVLDETIATLKADYAVSKADAIKADLVAAYIAEKLAATYTEAEGVKTPVAGGAWENEIFTLIAAELKAADSNLSDDAALAQAKTKDYKAAEYATLVATAYTNTEAAITTEANGVDFSAEIEAKVAELAEADANAYVASDEGEQAIFVRAMAESLYNEDAAEAVALRYDNMVKAAADAVAHVGTVAGIINTWNTAGLLWNDAQAIDAINAIAAWVANASYKSTNDAYIAAYAFVNANISDENRDYVYGTYNGAVTNFAQLNNVAGYVAAMLNIFNNGFDVKENEEVKFTVPGNEELIAAIVTAVNGVEVDGKIVLDVDNADFDKVVEYLAALEAELKTEACGANLVAAKLNYETMISEIIRNRIVVINTARAGLAAIISEIKAAYLVNGEWIVDDINAAPVIEAFEKRIDEKYAYVLNDSKVDLLFNVATSSLAEDAINNAYAAFEKFTEFAGQKYKEAKALIEKLEALGAVKLNHGKEIYDVAVALKTITVVIPGLTYETRFPVKNDKTGEFEMVDFYILQDKITNKYVPEYEDLAGKAETKAAQLKAEIEALVATVGNNANKLDNFNAIVNLMTKVNNEWLIAFYSDDMLAKDNANKYTKADNVIAAIKAAVKATTDTPIIGGLGKTYAFLANETFASLETITKTAINTYKTVESKAAAWIKDAVAIVNGGNYTFHDWDKSGKNFKNIEEAYAKIVKDYYIITALAADTDPDFGLYEAHEAFIVDYNKCKTAASEAATKIAEIENAINALGAYSTIKLYKDENGNIVDNTAERRAALNAIYTLIDAFETGYCGKAQEDGDIDADLLFELAKYDGVVTIFEYWASKKAEWPNTWNVTGAYHTVIESVESAIASGVGAGLDKDKVLENFITVNKSEVDKVIAEANN